MLKDFLELLSELGSRIRSSRVFFIGVAYAVLIGIMLNRLYSLQIVNGETYLNNYIQKTEKTVSTSATRGNIFDCKGKLLAYNKLSYSVAIQDNGDYKTSAARNTMLLTLVRILNAHGERVTGELHIGLDQDGNYYFTVNSDEAKRRLLRDFYGLKKTEELDDAAGKYPSGADAKTLIDSKAKTYKLDSVRDSRRNATALTPKATLVINNSR